MGRKRKYPRGVVILSISTDPETAQEFEERRGDLPRGEFLKRLLRATRGDEQKAQ